MRPFSLNAIANSKTLAEKFAGYAGIDNGTATHPPIDAPDYDVSADLPEPGWPERDSMEADDGEC